MRLVPGNIAASTRSRAPIRLIASAIASILTAAAQGVARDRLSFAFEPRCLRAQQHRSGTRGSLPARKSRTATAIAQWRSAVLGNADRGRTARAGAGNNNGGSGIGSGLG